MAVADLNGDGNQDLAVGGFGQPDVIGGSVSVLLGDGAGSFGSPISFAVGAGVRSVAVGDFNEDGRPDLATANFNDHSLSVLLNTTGVGIGIEAAGPGVTTLSFGEATRLPLAAGAAPFVVAVGDLDGDGNLDLASADQGVGTVTVYRGDGAGGFANAGSFAVGSSPRSVAIGDFDGDDRPDLVTANFNANSLTVLSNTSSGPGSVSFAATAVTGFPAGTRPFSVAVGDFNGDTRPDLAVANFANPGGLFVLLNNGAGAFPTVTPLASGQQPINVITGDFNGDSRLDLAVAEFGPGGASATGDVAVLEGDGSGGFGARVLYPVGLNPRWVASGDFNNNGAPDLVTADSSSNTVTVLLNQVAAPVLEITASTASPGEGTAFTVTVTALSGGAPAGDYRGTVTLRSDDPLAPVLGTHTFGPDDNGTFTFTVTLPTQGARTLTADDGTLSGTAAVTVANVPARLANVVLAPPARLGDATVLTGAIIDPGAGDSFTLVVDWGDGSAPQTFSYLPGTTTFSESHVFASGTSFSVRVSLTDNDRTGTVLYGSSGVGRELFTIDLATGAGTLLGTLPSPGQNITEIEYDFFRERAWLQYGGSGAQGQEFDPDTAGAIGAAVPNDPARSFTGLEFVGTTLYASGTAPGGGPSDLRILDPITGTSTLIGSTGLNGPLAGLAFDERTGALYGIRGGMASTDNFVRLDLATGAATVIGSTDFAGGSLEFGPDGLLYAGSNTGQLYRIDPATGASTLIGDPGFGSALSGLALIGPQVVDTVTLGVVMPAARVESVVVNDGAAQRSLVSSVTVTFSEAVVLPANPADAFLLVGPEGSVGLNGVVSLDAAGRTVVRLTFTGAGVVNGSLADGGYTLTVRGDRILDASGQPIDGDGNGTPGGDAITAFFRRYGDLDGNGLVEGLILINPIGSPVVTYGGELGALFAALDKRPGETGFVAALDANGDGQIDASDLAGFRLDRIESRLVS